MVKVSSLNVLVIFAACANQSFVRAAPTPEEIVGTYRHNYRRMGDLRVTWLYGITYEDGYRKDVSAQILAMTRLLDESNRPRMITKEQLRSQIRVLRQSLSDVGVESVDVSDVWTDGENVQIRNWKQDVGGEFPDASLSRSNLLSQYSNVTIASFMPNESPRSRFWSGATDGRGRGVLSDGALSSIVSVMLPPLGLAGEREQYNLHPLDEYMAKPLSQYTVTEQTKVGDAPCWVLEHRETLPAGPAEMKFASERVTQAWCDLSRGGLPLRVVVTATATKDGKPVASMKATKVQVLTVDNIVELSDGAFYPVAGTIKSRSESSRTTLTTYRWNASLVDDTVKCPKNLFSFVFPKRTSYADLRSGEQFAVGMDQKGMDKALNGVVPQRGFFIPWWLSFSVFAVFLVVLVIIRFRPTAQ